MDIEHIKQILLSGGSVSYSYKRNEEDWVSEAKISAISPFMGMDPHIVVQVNGYREYTLDVIDQGIEDFISRVFNEENLMYKFHEALLNLVEAGHTELDPDIDGDLKMIREERDRLIKEEV